VVTWKKSDIIHYFGDKNPAWKERDSFHIVTPPQFYCGKHSGSVSNIVQTDEINLDNRI